MDQLDQIWKAALGASAAAAADALGAPRETKGEDKRAEETKARMSPALWVGIGVAAIGAVLLVVSLRRR